MTPAEALAQRRTALRKAQRVRLHRARVKAELRAGEVGLFDAVSMECCATAKIGDLLLAVPGVGKVKAGKILHRAAVGQGRKCGSLTVRERAAVLAELGETT